MACGLRSSTSMYHLCLEVSGDVSEYDGNKISKRRAVVDERYTRPQGLYEHKDLDQKKLRRLILDVKLAPCYPGTEEQPSDLDECPICFLFYPTLNRSKCCWKFICTECFLQIKAPHSAHSTQCPFCKTPNYAVEYCGAKTLEEKGVEQAEEQAKKELKDEHEKLQRREGDQHHCGLNLHSEVLSLDFSNSHGFNVSSAAADDGVIPRGENVSVGRLHDWSLSVATRTILEEGNLSSTTEAGDLNGSVQVSAAASLLGENPDRGQTLLGDTGGDITLHRQLADMSGSSITGTNWDDELALDLEDVMVMEAIWLSIQERSPW